MKGQLDNDMGKVLVDEGVLAWHRHDNHAFYNKRLSRHHHNHPVSGNRI